MLGILLSLGGLASTDVLGDFSEVGNDVGYLDFDAYDVLYAGNLELEDRKEGVQIEDRTPSRIFAEEFIDLETGAFRPEAILSRIVRLADEEVEHYTLYCQRKGDECEEDPDEVYDDWLDRKSHEGYRFAYKRLKEAFDLATAFNAGGHLEHLDISAHRLNENLPEIVAFRQALLEGLEVMESLALDAAGTTKRSNNLRSIISLLANHMRKHGIKSGRHEASNLLIDDFGPDSARTQTFYSPEQLAAYEGDISLLDPPDSGFWRKPRGSISSYNTTNHNLEGTASLKKSVKDDLVPAILDRSIPVDVEYEEDDDLGGRTPKVTVRMGGHDWKMKYVTHRRDMPFTLNPGRVFQKRWLGSEVGVEPVVNNLAAAIGYTVEPTYYQERVRLYFRGRVYRGTEDEQARKFEAAREEMILTLDEAFPGSNIRSAFQSVNVDEQGRRYIEVREVTLEKKTDERTDLNLGYYMRAGFGKSFKREFRAFSVFLSWISDPDIKDANVKAKLVPVRLPDGSASHRLVYSASDMGGALGTGFPNLFKKDYIDKIHLDENGRFEAMRLTFRSIFPAPLLKAVSYADFRWIARMIGQLTWNQIYDAFAEAGHPDVVAHYYTEILLRRRDQMVEAAGLMGESYTDPWGNRIVFEPLTAMMDPRSFSVPGYEQYFNKGKLRYKNDALFDEELGHFPRYWGTKFPWQ